MDIDHPDDVSGESESSRDHRPETARGPHEGIVLEPERPGMVEANGTEECADPPRRVFVIGGAQVPGGTGRDLLGLERPYIPKPFERRAIADAASVMRARHFMSGLGEVARWAGVAEPFNKMLRAQDAAVGTLMARSMCSAIGTAEASFASRWYVGKGVEAAWAPLLTKWYAPILQDLAGRDLARVLRPLTDSNSAIFRQFSGLMGAPTFPCLKLAIHDFTWEAEWLKRSFPGVGFQVAASFSVPSLATPIGAHGYLSGPSRMNGRDLLDGVLPPAPDSELELHGPTPAARIEFDRRVRSRSHEAPSADAHIAMASNTPTVMFDMAELWASAQRRGWSTDDLIRAFAAAPGAQVVMVAPENMPAPPVLTAKPVRRGSTGNRVVIFDQGGVFEVRFRGKTACFKKVVGLKVLKILTDDPDKDHSCLDLRMIATGGIIERALVGENEAAMQRFGLKEGQARLAELREEIEDASMYSHWDRKAKLEMEQDELEARLNKGQPKDGPNPKRRKRKPIPPEVDKARKAVRESVLYAVQKIDEKMPELADHLRDRVVTGCYCRYRKNK